MACAAILARDPSSHSQTTRTCQPSACSWPIMRTSRETFRAYLSVRTACSTFGVVAILHPSWRCQKQPWTKMPTLCRVSDRRDPEMADHHRQAGHDRGWQGWLHHWAWSSETLIRSGIYYAARLSVIELPPASLAAQEVDGETGRHGRVHPAGVWLGSEPVR